MSRNPAAILYDVSGSLFGTPTNRIHVSGTLDPITGSVRSSLHTLAKGSTPEGYPTSTSLSSGSTALDVIMRSITGNSAIPPHSRDANNEQVTQLTNGSPVVFTVDEPNNKVLSIAHGLVAGRVVHLTTTVTLPSPLVASTPYYVVNPTTDDFQLSLTANGFVINLLDTGSGVHSYKVAGEFVGTFTRVDDIEHFEILYASLTTLTVVQKEWSNDGVTQLSGLFGTSTIPVAVLSGFNVYYDVNEGRNSAPYYRLKVINGPVDQGPIPAFISVIWLMKTAYHGSFGTLTGSLNNLSRALLVRSVMAGVTPDNQFVNVQLDKDADFQISARQLTDVGNTVLITSASVSGSTPSVPWVGTPFATRGRNIQENLTTVAAFNSSGSLFDLGGTMTFRYWTDVSGSASSANIVEVLSVRSFSTVRNVGWLSNAGDYYSFEFVPDRVLTSGETVAITTVHSKLAGNDFKRLPSQALEEENQATTVTTSFLKAYFQNGNSANIRATPDSALRVADDRLRVTRDGSLATQGFRDDISIKFSDGTHLDEITGIISSGSVSGSVTFDPIEGRVVFSVPTTTGSIALFRSNKTAVYEPGHSIVGEQTISLNQLPTGDAVVEWGFGSPFGSSLAWRVDSGGKFVVRRKNGVLVEKVAQVDWNRDKLDGNTRSLFFRDFEPEALNVINNNRYTTEYEWLGAAPPVFHVHSPGGGIVTAHVIEHPNSAPGTTIPQPQLPLYIYVSNGSSGQSLSASCGSWRVGTLTSKIVQTARDPNDNYNDVRSQGRHLGNSTVTPLSGNTGGSDHIFRGTWFEWQSAYATAVIDMSSDVSGTLNIDFSQEDSPVNGDDSSVTDSVEIDYDPLVTPLLRRHLPVQSKWVRTRYTNGAAAQSEFSLDTLFTPYATTPGLKPAFLNLAANSLTTMTDTIVSAFRSDDSNEPVHVLTTRSNNKDGLHVHVTGIEDHVAIRPLEAAQARQFTIGATAVQIDTPTLSTPGKRRALGVQTRGLSWIAYGFANTITFAGNSMLLPPNSFKSIALDEGVSLWAITEQLGGIQTTFNLTGSTAGGNATSPSNALTSNDSRATLAFNQTLFVTGVAYTPTANSTVQSVRIGCEARKQPGQAATTSHRATVAQASTEGGGNVGTLTSDTVSGNASRLLLVAVSRENQNSVVNSVTNTGTALSWSKLIDVTAASSRRLDVWSAFGNPDPTFTVTVTFSQVATNCHIAVTSFNDANSTSTIAASGSNTGTGTAVLGPSLTGADKQLSYLAVIQGGVSNSATPGAGYTDRSDESTTGGPAANRDSLSVHTKNLTVGGAEQGSATLASSTDWAAAGIIVNNAPAQDPVITLSYHTPSGSMGLTTGSLTYSSETDQTQYLTITNDRSWTEANVDNILLIASGTSILSASCEVDQLFVEVVDTTGNTMRVSVEQYAGSS